MTIKLLLLAMMLLSKPVHATDDEGGGQKVVYKDKTEIDFEELEIEGILQKPQSALVLERKQASFNPLVKLRTDWNTEINQSVNEIK